MRKNILTFFLFFAIIFAFSACGGAKTTDDALVTFDEEEYIEPMTEEEQVAKTQSDKALYKQAKAEVNPRLCDKIQSLRLKKTCVENTQ